MSAREFRRVSACYCGEEPCICAAWEAELASQDLDHLESEDSFGNILLSNKGAGKLRDADHAQSRDHMATLATVTLAWRRTILERGSFGVKPVGGKNQPARVQGEQIVARAIDRQIWELYASGYGSQRISEELSMSETTVKRHIAEIKRQNQHLIAEPSLSDLIRQCEPSTLVLFFALLQKALSEPAAVAQMLADAQRNPELRALIDPEIEDEPTYL